MEQKNLSFLSRTIRLSVLLLSCIVVSLRLTASVGHAGSLPFSPLQRCAQGSDTTIVDSAGNVTVVTVRTVRSDTSYVCVDSAEAVRLGLRDTVIVETRTLTSDTAVNPDRASVESSGTGGSDEWIDDWWSRDVGGGGKDVRVQVYGTGEDWSDDDEHDWDSDRDRGRRRHWLWGSYGAVHLEHYVGWGFGLHDMVQRFRRGFATQLGFIVYPKPYFGIELSYQMLETPNPLTFVLPIINDMDVHYRNVGLGFALLPLQIADPTSPHMFSLVAGLSVYINEWPYVRVPDFVLMDDANPTLGVYGRVGYTYRVLPVLGIGVNASLVTPVFFTRYGHVNPTIGMNFSLLL